MDGSEGGQDCADVNLKYFHKSSPEVHLRKSQIMETNSIQISFQQWNQFVDKCYCDNAQKVVKNFIDIYSDYVEQLAAIHERMTALRRRVSDLDLDFEQIDAVDLLDIPPLRGKQTATASAPAASLRPAAGVAAPASPATAVFNVLSQENRPALIRSRYEAASELATTALDAATAAKARRLIEEGRAPSPGGLFFSGKDPDDEEIQGAQQPLLRSVSTPPAASVTRRLSKLFFPQSSAASPSAAAKPPQPPVRPRSADAGSFGTRRRWATAATASTSTSTKPRLKTDVFSQQPGTPTSAAEPLKPRTVKSRIYRLALARSRSVAAAVAESELPSTPLRRGVSQSSPTVAAAAANAAVDKEAAEEELTTEADRHRQSLNSCDMRRSAAPQAPSNDEDPNYASLSDFAGPHGGEPTTAEEKPVGLRQRAKNFLLQRRRRSASSAGGAGQSAARSRRAATVEAAGDAVEAAATSAIARRHNSDDCVLQDDNNEAPATRQLQQQQQQQMQSSSISLKKRLSRSLSFFSSASSRDANDGIQQRRQQPPTPQSPAPQQQPPQLSLTNSTMISPDEQLLNNLAGLSELVQSRRWSLRRLGDHLAASSAATGSPAGIPLDRVRLWLQRGPVVGGGKSDWRHSAAGPTVGKSATSDDALAEDRARLDQMLHQLASGASVTLRRSCRRRLETSAAAPSSSSEAWLAAAVSMATTGDAAPANAAAAAAAASSQTNAAESGGCARQQTGSCSRELRLQQRLSSGNWSGSSASSNRTQDSRAFNKQLSGSATSKDSALELKFEDAEQQPPAALPTIAAASAAISRSRNHSSSSGGVAPVPPRRSTSLRKSNCVGGNAGDAESSRLSSSTEPVYAQVMKLTQPPTPPPPPPPPPPPVSTAMTTSMPLTVAGSRLLDQISEATDREESAAAATAAASAAPAAMFLPPRRPPGSRIPESRSTPSISGLSRLAPTPTPPTPPPPPPSLALLKSPPMPYKVERRSAGAATSTTTQSPSSTPISTAGAGGGGGGAGGESWRIIRDAQAKLSHLDRLSSDLLMLRRPPAQTATDFPSSGGFCPFDPVAQEPPPSPPPPLPPPPLLPAASRELGESSASPATYQKLYALSRDAANSAGVAIRQQAKPRQPILAGQISDDAESRCSELHDENAVRNYLRDVRAACSELP